MDGSNVDACVIKLDALEPLRKVVRRRAAHGEDELCLVSDPSIVMNDWSQR